MKLFWTKWLKREVKSLIVLTRVKQALSGTDYKQTILFLPRVVEFLVAIVNLLCLIIGLYPQRVYVRGGL